MFLHTQGPDSLHLSFPSLFPCKLSLSLAWLHCLKLDEHSPSETSEEETKDIYSLYFIPITPDAFLIFPCRKEFLSLYGYVEFETVVSIFIESETDLARLNCL